MKKRITYAELFTNLACSSTNKSVKTWGKRLVARLVEDGHSADFAEEYADIICIIKLQDKGDYVMSSATRRQFYRLLCQKHQLETQPLEPQ